jgi:hypothetical protein
MRGDAFLPPCMQGAWGMVTKWAVLRVIVALALALGGHAYQLRFPRWKIFQAQPVGPALHGDTSASRPGFDSLYGSPGTPLRSVIACRASPAPRARRATAGAESPDQRCEATRYSGPVPRGPLQRRVSRHLTFQVLESGFSQSRLVMTQQGAECHCLGYMRTGPSRGRDPCRRNHPGMYSDSWRLSPCARLI